MKKKDDEIKALKETMAKLQPLIDLVNSYPTVEQMKAELGLTKEYDKSDKLYSAKTMPGELAEIQTDETGREPLVQKKGLPLTREEYESRRKKQTKSPRQKRG